MTTPNDVLNEYLAGANAADPARVLALYDDEVRVFDAYGTWQVRGKPDWQRGVEEWLGEMKPGGWCAAEDVTVVEAGDMAVVTAVVLYGAETRAGDTAEVRNRLTHVLRRADDRWLIVHEHSSVPLAMSMDRPLDQP